MKIVLAHGYFLNGDEVEQKVMKPYPPLGLLYVSGYLSEQGLHHEVYDTTFSSYEDFQEYISNGKPEIIGLYVNFLTRVKVLKIIQFMKSTKGLQNAKIILGGPDVRYNAQKYLESGADFIVKGEGEITFFNLVSALLSGESTDGIKGICYKNTNADFCEQEEDPMIKDLSGLALPARHKVDIKKYLQVWKENHGYSSISINTQRGCSFTCTWCSHSVFGDTYRRRPVHLVLEEIKMLIQAYNPESFWFVDDVFTMSEKWISEFVAQLKSKNMQISYECISRADRLNENIIQDLSRSGCKMLWIGAESGSQKVLDLMDRRVQAPKVREMIKLAKTYGIKTGTFIMLGYPDENLDDINETIRHLKACNPDVFTINKAYPIKGTRFYEKVKNEIDSDYQWENMPDRDVEFERTYNNQFYKMAIRKMYNSVYAHKHKLMGNTINYYKHKIKSIASDLALQVLK